MAVRRRHVERAPRRDRHRLREGAVLALFVGVPAVMQAVLIWLPIAFGVVLSFTRWNGVGSPSASDFTGWDNYKYIIFTYKQFWPAVQHNLLWLAFMVLVVLPGGVLLAVVLDTSLKGSAVYESIFFTPVMLSLALVGIIWDLIYSPRIGLLNNLLGLTEVKGAPNWYGDPDLNLWVAMVANGWQQGGMIMLLYLAGLKSIDSSLREAAALDGAGAFRTFFRIIVPVMKPINVIVIIIVFINSLRAFDIVWVINQGTNGLELLNTIVVRFLQGEAFDIGSGSAVASILLVVSLIPVILYLRTVFRSYSE